MRLWSIKKSFKVFETREIIYKHMTYDLIYQILIYYYISNLLKNLTYVTRQQKIMQNIDLKYDFFIIKKIYI